MFLSPGLEYSRAENAPLVRQNHPLSKSWSWEVDIYRVCVSLGLALLSHSLLAQYLSSRLRVSSVNKRHWWTWRQGENKPVFFPLFSAVSALACVCHDGCLFHGLGSCRTRPHESVFCQVTPVSRSSPPLFVSTDQKLYWLPPVLNLWVSTPNPIWLLWFPELSST